MSGRVATYLRLPPELHARLSAAAEERVVSINLLATRAIAEYLDRLVPVDEVLATDE